MTARILLTGATGQVGRALSPRLREFGEIVAPTRAELDLAEPEAIRRVLREVRPGLIVNPGAYTAVDRAEDEPDHAAAVNTRAPEILAAEAARLGAALVHYSTDYVYDGAKTGPYVETDATAPLGVYGATKLAGEAAIRASGVPHLILRTSWVYDAEGANFLNTMLHLGAERRELAVVNDQFGAPTGAGAIAAATAAILGRAKGAWSDRFRREGGVVHMTCAGTTTWHGFAEAIFAGARRRGAQLAVEAVRPIATADYKTKARRPTNSRLDLGLLQRRFGVVMPDWGATLEAVLDRRFGPA